MFQSVILVFSLFLISTCLGFIIEPKPYHESRIVGGKDAAAGQFPWMISLRHRDSHLCGGSIISSKWILTAAHCVQYNNATEDYMVVAGSISLSSGGTAYHVSRLIMHEEYYMPYIINDVAVIELVEEIEFTELVKPIELGTEFVDEVDSVLSGWGFLYTDGSAPDNLQYMNRRTITLEECRKYDIPLPVTDDEICTLTVAGELGFCSGDSGSPLVSDGKQIGIVSWGIPCALGYPDVYMRVSSFADWIKKTINT